MQNQRIFALSVEIFNVYASKVKSLNFGAAGGGGGWGGVLKANTFMF